MTKTKKKILGLALSVSMIASCFTGMSVPASADGDTSTYTITIPSTLTVSGSGWNATSGISATGTLGSGKKLTVTASSANSFKLKSGNNEVGYTLTTAEGGSQTTSWEFDSLSSTATTKPLGIIVEDYSSKPAGTYTDTVTFTASVASANNPYAANSVGDVVTFGNYSWYIIGKSDNGVTLLMNANLTTKGYNDSYASVTWETCSLRTYLNGEFYNGSGFKINELNEKREADEPKCVFYDNVLQAQDLIPMTLIAKDYGMSATRLNSMLYAFGVQYRMNCGTWVLYADYQDLGYTQTVTIFPRYDYENPILVMYWTHAGREFLYRFLKERGIVPVTERETDTI